VHFADYEMIIVDDHSSDSTPSIGNNLAAYYEPIMIIHQPRKRGYARSLITGAMAARGDYMLIMDTNQTLHASHIEHLLPYMGQYDVITGYPVLPHPQRKLQQVWRNLLATLLSIELPTIDCFFLLVRTSLFQNLAFTARSSLIIPELYAHAAYVGYTHIQLGVRPQPYVHPAAGTGYAQRHRPSLREIIQVRDNLHKTYTPSKQPIVWMQRAFVTVGLVEAIRRGWGILRRRKRAK
jgi:glycosyltransferase involved in cell wall biosynthesis